MGKIEEMYQEACQKSHKTEDIYLHLPKLRECAEKCDYITEFGTRRGNSTIAFLASKPKLLISYDIAKWDDILEIEEAAKEDGIDYKFVKANDLEVVIEPTQLLFIDTFHSYSQLKAELKMHSHKALEYIALHDTTTYGEVGEDGYTGIWKAVEELIAEGIWKIEYKSEENNGLTILSK